MKLWFTGVLDLGMLATTQLFQLEAAYDKPKS